MIQRKRFDKIPLQGNYYPLPTAGYIEDPNMRLTILSGQPLGASSLASGEFEVSLNNATKFGMEWDLVKTIMVLFQIIMDRRLMQDDNRGVAQGDTDNLETENVFRLLFESPSCQVSFCSFCRRPEAQGNVVQ